MIETLVALVFAHALADFVIQTSRMASEKNKGRWKALALHALVVAVLTAAAIGIYSVVALGTVVAVAVTHLLIDWGKARFDANVSSFLVDQTAHLVVLILVAALCPGLWASGLLANFQWLPPMMAIAAGLIFAVRAGGFAVGLLMEPWKLIGDEGLPGAGATIGTIERFLIFLLALAGELGAIGFLIAAKSVLRFGTVREGRALSEYVIVGTLASFAWALACSLATLGVLEVLAPLGFPALSR
jgi:hypothetical protein